jgi:hypothetical protein
LELDHHAQSDRCDRAVRIGDAAGVVATNVLERDGAVILGFDRAGVFDAARPILRLRKRDRSLASMVASALLESPTPVKAMAP